MEKEFMDWYKKEQRRFHCGQFDERQIAYAAWLEGRTLEKNREPRQNTEPGRDQVGIKMSADEFIQHRYSSRFRDKWDRVAKLFDYYDMTDFAEAYIDYLNE